MLSDLWLDDFVTDLFLAAPPPGAMSDDLGAELACMERWIGGLMAALGRGPRRKAAGRIASVYQDGLIEKPAPSSRPVRYPARQLLGLTDLNEAEISEIMFDMRAQCAGANRTAWPTVEYDHIETRAGKDRFRSAARDQIGGLKGID
ncbi:phage virion morphogenesis protein [Novosphingopyxis sp. YJ-S2-01]|uniref:phage virion morphogenesis protein n=1 Tax=Novosphingopyxis sp. YJ-S2-01 TaxID=2794021 RepID=UPI0018DBE462|nr:phage virion morphogenesis protein [Novosphingopyxis sp. YJ-S2-01]MBH9537894.1 phage virion morphogenesis protein [Novosphingopyxis sp. YJ-S2-01]